MNQKVVKAAGLVSSGAVALYLGAGIFGPSLPPVFIMMAALMAFGTLLARESVAPGVLVSTGVFAGGDAVMRLVGQRWPSMPWNSAYLVAALVTMAVGLVMLRAGRPPTPRSGPTSDG